MNILCIICTHPWMKPAFVDGWESTGAQVEVFYYNRGVIRKDFSPKGEAAVAQMNREMVQKAVALKAVNSLDLIFFSILDDYITADTLLQLKKLGAPLVNYHADMGYLWYRLLKTGRYFDLICCAQKLYMHEYEKRGFRVMYLPFGSNDRLNGSEPELRQGDIFEGVRYLGSPIVDRPRILGYLFKQGIPLEIYGNHWHWYPRDPTPKPDAVVVKKNGFRFPRIKVDPKGRHDTRYYFGPRLRAEGWSFLYGLSIKLQAQWFPKVPDAETFYAGIPTWSILGEYAEEDFARLVRTAAINIGFTHLHKRRGPHRWQKQIRLRDVEIPMTGGFLLAEHCRETEDYFTPGIHLDTWREEGELLEKVRWYLAHPEDRWRIAKAGRAHALAHHTWKHRFEQLLNETARL